MWVGRYVPKFGESQYCLESERAAASTASFEEQVEAMGALIKEGKVRTFYMSNIAFCVTALINQRRAQLNHNIISVLIRVTMNWSGCQIPKRSVRCTAYRVHPTALHTLVGVPIPLLYTHQHKSLEGLLRKMT